MFFWWSRVGDKPGCIGLLVLSKLNGVLFFFAHPLLVVRRGAFATLGAELAKRVTCLAFITPTKPSPIFAFSGMFVFFA